MQIKYDEEKIYYIEENKEIVVINDNLPSKPELSPDGNKIIYISPSEWETVGELFVFDLKERKNKLLFKPESNEFTPKKALWVDDYKVALIIGFSMGTVAIGGNIYMYNLKTKKIEQITSYSDEVQVTDLNIKDNTLLLEGVKYLDKEYMTTIPYSDTVSIN